MADRDAPVLYISMYIVHPPDPSGVRFKLYPIIIETHDSLPCTGEQTDTGRRKAVRVLRSL